MVSDERALEHLSAMLGSSLIASSAYQKMAHVELSLAPEVHECNHWILPIYSLIISREQHVPDSSNHSLDLLKLFNSTYPEGNSGGNQLLDGSTSLSPFSKV